MKDVYRIGENEVFVVDGGTVAPFDLPAVRAFIRVFAPRRGEIVVDAESLDLRPAKVRAPDPTRPKAPRRTSRRKRSGPATNGGPSADATTVGSTDGPVLDDRPAGGAPAEP